MDQIGIRFAHCSYHESRKKVRKKGYGNILKLFCILWSLNYSTLLHSAPLQQPYATLLYFTVSIILHYSMWQYTVLYFGSHGHVNAFQHEHDAQRQP